MVISNDELWQSVLSELEIQVSRANFLTWLKNSKLLKIDSSGEAVVALPNHFAKEWVEAKYNKMILGYIRTQNESIKKIDYIVEGNLTRTEKVKPTAAPEAEEKKQLVFQEMKIDPETNLNPRYTMGSFVVGSSNQMVYSVATAIINSIGTKYNPLFIYGGVGLGKTHLIQALGNEIKRMYDNKVKVKYVTSEKFTSDVVWAIRNRRMEDIKNMYRHVDVLIVDDIQFIGGKEKTEEEFFHTFNALYETNKQIIISSDRRPEAIPILEERLRSRFKVGMTCDIGYPDYETRVAIIKNKLQERAVNFSEEIVDLIGKKVQRNIREIEGILTRLIFHETNFKKALDLQTADKIISELIDKPATNINPNQIINAVAKYFETSPNDIVGRARNKELIEPRQVSVYLLRNMLNMSYPFIAKKIGNRDHTTAIYSFRKISDEIEKNSQLNQKILAIKEELGKLGA